MRSPGAHILRRTAWRAGTLSAVLLLATGCRSGGGAPAPAQPAVPVTVATTVQKDVPIDLHAIGNVEPYSTVSVRSQVDGQLAQVHFHEGEAVQKGDLLFTIDPRSFAAALQQAEANLQRDAASFENAALEERREHDLIARGIVSQSEYDQAHASAAALRATVAADRAAVEDARLKLQYCYIHSPIAGRIGQILIHQGNVVKTNDTILAVINQVRPIYVSFSLPEQDLAEVRARAGAGTLPVHAYPSKGNPSDPVAGELSFINNTVDTSTGTILLKGRFANDDEVLWPGQFVDVALTLGMHRQAVLVPSQAVEAGQEGQYVYVVGPDLTVTLRHLETGGSFGTETIVTKGLQAGERVVTDGQVRLAPGFKVEIKSGNAAGGSGR